MSNKKLPKWAKITLVVVAVFFVLGLLLPEPKEKTKAANNQQKQDALAVQQEPPILQVFAQDIFYDFKSNAIAAKDKYADKEFVVKGIIAAIEPDGDGAMLLINDGDAENIGINCYFEEEKTGEIKLLKVGDGVKVKGTGGGDASIDYTMSDCAVVPFTVGKPAISYKVVKEDRNKKDLAYRVVVDSNLTHLQLYQIGAYLKSEAKWFENYSCFLYKQKSDVTSIADVIVSSTPRMNESDTTIAGEPFSIEYLNYLKR